MPDEVKSGDQLSVKIEKQHLTISVKGIETPVIDRNLLKEVKTDTAVWYFEPDDQQVSIIPFDFSFSCMTICFQI